jgi:hypothetical protein
MRRIRYNKVTDQAYIYRNSRIPALSSSESLNIGSTVVGVTSQFENVENVRTQNNLSVPSSSRELSIPPENLENFQIDVMLSMQELSAKMNDQQKIIIEQQIKLNEQYTAVGEKTETIKNNTSFLSALKISVCSSTLTLAAAKLYEHPELVALGVKAARVFVATHTKDFSDIDK